MKYLSKAKAKALRSQALGFTPSVTLRFAYEESRYTRSSSLCWRVKYAHCAEHGILDPESIHYSKNVCPQCTKVINSASTLASKAKNNKAGANLQKTLDLRHSRGKGARVLVVGRDAGTTTVHLSCERHGTWSDNLRRVRDNMSFTCPQCAKEAALDNVASAAALERFTQRCPDRRNKNVKLYKNQEYAGTYSRLRAHCVVHKMDVPINVNSFNSGDSYNTRSTLCPSCKFSLKLDTRLDNGTAWTFDAVQEKLASNKASVSCVTWLGITKQNVWTCTVDQSHGDFVANGQRFLYETHAVCPSCARTSGSKVQREIFRYVLSLCPDAVEEKRFSELGESSCRRRLDIYVPSLRKAIEVDGVRWHSEKKTLDALSRKTRNAQRYAFLNSVGVGLFVISDVDWYGKEELFKAALRNYLVQPATKVAARKLTLVSMIEAADAKAFASEFHLQGAPHQARNNVALLDGSSLIALMTFAPVTSVRGTKATDDTWELTRYVVRPGYVIIGGAQRMLSSFLKRHAPKSVVSYSHNKWFTGDGYKRLGFDFVSNVAPDYQTFWEGQYGQYGVRSKQFSKRDNLARIMGSDFDPTLSEGSNLDKAGVKKLYDYGKRKWIYYPTLNISLK